MIRNQIIIIDDADEIFTLITIGGAGVCTEFVHCTHKLSKVTQVHNKSPAQKLWIQEDVVCALLSTKMCADIYILIVYTFIT